MTLTLLSLGFRLAGDPESYTNGGLPQLGNYNEYIPGVGPGNLNYSIGSVVEWRMEVYTDLPASLTATESIVLSWAMGMYPKLGSAPEVNGSPFPTRYVINIPTTTEMTLLNVDIIPTTTIPTLPYRKGLYSGFNIAGNWKFVIYGTFYLLEDIAGLFNNGYYLSIDPSNNRRRLLYDAIGNPNELTLTAQSAYSGTNDLRITAWVDKTDTAAIPPTPQKTSGMVVGKKTNNYRFYNYEAGFNPANTATTAYDPEWILEDDGFVTDSFTPFSLTTVKFRFKSDQDYRYIMVWMIRVDTDDNTVNIGQNYQFDNRWLDNTFATLPSVHDFPDWTPRTAHLVAPATLPIYTLAPQCEATFHINPTYLVLNATYRLICVVHTRPAASPDYHQTHSFISPAYQVKPQVPIVPPILTRTWTSPYNTFGNDDIPSFTPYERIESFIDIDATDYITNIFTVTGIPDISIYARVEGRLAYPDGIVEHVLDTFFSDQDPSTGNFKPSNYPNPNALRYMGLNTPGPGLLQIKNRFIVRNDPNIPNLFTYNPTANTLTAPQINQDWQGKKLSLITMIYVYIKAGIYQWQDLIIIPQAFQVKFLDTIDISAVYKDNLGNPVAQICIDIPPHQITASTISALDDFSFAYLPPTGDTLSAKIADAFTPTSPIPQLNQTPFSYASGDTANFNANTIAPSSFIAIVAGTV